MIHIQIIVVSCAGQSGLGKSTLVDTLFKSKVSRKSCSPDYEEKISKTVQLQSVSHGESEPEELQTPQTPQTLQTLHGLQQAVLQQRSVPQGEGGQVGLPRLP